MKIMDKSGVNLSTKKVSVRGGAISGWNSLLVVDSLLCVKNNKSFLKSNFPHYTKQKKRDKCMKCPRYMLRSILAAQPLFDFWIQNKINADANFQVGWNHEFQKARSDDDNGGRFNKRQPS